MVQCQGVTMTVRFTKISLWARCMHCLSPFTDLLNTGFCVHMCVWCECVHALACVLSEDNFGGLILIFQLVFRQGLSFSLLLLCSMPHASWPTIFWPYFLLPPPILL